jgi:ATP-dependent Clp protease ATP-binding subunit ClpB
MENILGKRVVGQEAGYRGGLQGRPPCAGWLQDPGRPLGSFLFLGPTGVGKTELTKALAGFLFDDDRRWCAST